MPSIRYWQLRLLRDSVDIMVMLLILKLFVDFLLLF